MVWKGQNKMDRDDPVFLSFAARQAQAALAENPASFLSPSLGHILCYATRPDALADLQIERSLRDNPHWRRLYLDHLRKQSTAWSDLARAASEAVLLSRDIGPNRLELIDVAGDAILLITLSDPQPGTYVIEARLPEGNGVRLDLGQPIGTALQILLSEDFPETKTLKDLLQRPETILFLILKAPPK